MRGGLILGAAVAIIVLVGFFNHGASALDSTTTSVTPNQATVNSGAQITFTATVTDNTNHTNTPTGIISWSDNNAHGIFTVTSCTLPSGGCTTSYTTSINSPSSVTVTASYSGDSSHSGSAGISSLSVRLLHRTTATITPNPATLSFNGTVKFIVMVNDSSSSPTTPVGAVSWKDNNGGGFFNVTSCTLSSGSCASMYTASGNPPNVITINATYPGDNTHSGSWAVSRISTNVFDATTTTITPNPATFTPRNSVTFTATVADTSNPSAALIGIVSWSDSGAGGSFDQNGCSLAGNHCSMTYTPPSSPLYAITITASYAGDSHHSGSSGVSSLSLKPSTQSTPPTTQTTPPSQSTPPTTGPNNTQGGGVPEFPTAMFVLLIAIATLIAFYRIKPIKI